jgi:membrane-associated phospholipid phosphatase
MPLRATLRRSEWIAIAYFIYVSAIAPFYIRAPWRAWILAGVVATGFWLVRNAKPILRDLAPLLAVLAAYREMDWLTPAVRDLHLENGWIVWDRLALDTYGLRPAIESAGPLLPNFFELCYLLVYGMGPMVVVVAILSEHRHKTDDLWTGYLVGTLGAYALFPYFPSVPPRIAFPGADLPHFMTLLRQINLLIVGGYGIHSSVFPSAHVSSAFSAAWALLATLEKRKWIGWAMAAYACSVAIATVYGRYHYAADVLAGFGVSLVALATLVWINRSQTL